MDELSSRADIAAAITADLSQSGQAETPPAVATESATAEATTVDTESGTPAPVSEQDTPTPLKLTDKSLVEDPADGKVKPWGEIKSERLMRADYDRKRGAEAQRMREFEAQERQRQAEFDAWQAKQNAPVELPEDENGLLTPYAQRILAIEKQTQAYFTAQQVQEQRLENERLAVANERLDVQIQKVTDEYKLSQREMDRVGRETLARIKSGEDVTIESIAKEYAEERDDRIKSEREAALKEFKQKHRVGAGPGDVSIPAASVPDTMPAQGTRAWTEMIRQHLVGQMQ